MSLARRVRDHRYSKGWGPDELCDRADISRTALYQIESGKTETPRAATVRRLARALEVPVAALMEYDLGEVAPEPAATEPPVVQKMTGQGETVRKFLELLRHPVGEALGKLVEDLHRLI